ncbi:hypothetical protein INT80_12515 [Gallibacterium anatis]|uniref:Uncharacterized protein n=1 Tax=Gallibacterium anatis TaxID=750 RepID=A0A930Y5G3_9PAST|nr:hypothetical protein [Gallibacterium anatis]
MSKMLTVVNSSWSPEATDADGNTINATILKTVSANVTLPKGTQAGVIRYLDCYAKKRINRLK